MPITDLEQGQVLLTPEAQPSLQRQLLGGMETENIIFNAARAVRRSIFSTEAIEAEENAPLTSEERARRAEVQQRVFGGDAESDTFDLKTELTEEEKLDPSPFLGIDNAVDLARKRRELGMEDEARRVVEKGPAHPLFASAFGALTDPTAFVGFGAGILAKGGTLAKIGKGAGATALEAGVSEVALHSFQDRRTAEESVANILLSSVFGAGVGSIAGLVAARSGRTGEELVREAAADLTDAVGTPRAPESVGAAAQVIEEAADTVPFRQAYVKAVDKVMSPFGVLTPTNTRLATSQNSEVRRLTRELVDTGILTVGEARGMTATGAPITTRLKIYEAMAIEANQAARKHYDLGGKAEGFATLADFNEAVGRALRQGDKSPSLAVTNAAKDLRKAIDKVKDDAVELGLLPKDIEPRFAESYLTRVFDRDLVLKHRPELRNMIITKLRIMLDEADRSDPDLFGELPGIADNVINRILGSEVGLAPDLSSLKLDGAPGSLKERTLPLTDTELLSIGGGEGVLVNRVDQVLPRFFRGIGGHLELERAGLNREGFEARLNKIQDEHNQAIAAAKSAKERQKLQKAFDQETKLLERIRAQVLGLPTSSDFDRALGQRGRTVGRVLRNFNFVNKLGGVTLSSIPDVGKIIMAEGLARSMGDIFSDAAGGFKAIRMSKKLANEWGTAFDWAANQRSEALFDFGETMLAEGKLAEFSDRAARGFAKATLLPLWNDGLKAATGAVVSNRILRSVTSAKIGKQDLRRLAESRITPEMQKRIAAQSEHFEEVNGILLPNLGHWTDQEAAEAFGFALVRDIDNTIITPGIGDRPSWTEGESGRLVFQFKQFAVAATQRIIIQGGQKLSTGDLATLNGLIAIVGMGFVSGELKNLAAGRDRKDESVAATVLDAVDRSGVAGPASDLYNILNVFSGGQLGKQLGFRQPRFRDRNLAGAIGGPTAGTLQDVQSLLAESLDGDGGDGMAHKVRRLLPAQNLFYTRRLFNALEEAAE